MFAVFKTGGKQYRVAADDKITVMTVVGNPGDIVVFNEVLMLSHGETSVIGTPTCPGVSVAAAIVEHDRGPKVIAFKKRRRKNSKRKRGHKQDLTILQITEILTNGDKPSKTYTAAAPRAGAVAVADTASTGASGAVSEDIETIGGIGPTIGKKLKAAGITTWKQVAAWTEADIAKWDAELTLRGRIVREEWVEQAKELMAGKPPRAKSDQAKAGKD